jgi:hypothetical protein
MGMVVVIATDEFADWYQDLEVPDAEAVNRSVRRLEQKGVTLGFPQSSAIQTSRHALRELRVQSAGRPLRVFYAFDPRRQAVLLIGGDKTGNDRFYEKAVPLADDIFDAYLAEQAAGLHPGPENEED